jgi:hypothetical protein
VLAVPFKRTFFPGQEERYKFPNMGRPRVEIAFESGGEGSVAEGGGRGRGRVGSMIGVVGLFLGRESSVGGTRLGALALAGEEESLP